VAKGRKRVIMNIYLALVHHPIKNKKNELVTTSVTNLDIHDISRSCRTYGMEKYFIVTPLKAQHELVLRLLGHWEQDKSAAYNPDRQDALEKACLVHSVEESIEQITNIEGTKPLLVATGANFEGDLLSESEVLERAKVDNKPILLLFGTGWGIHSSLLEQVDVRLAPLVGSPKDSYNHLSVRSAVAIYLDRVNEAQLRM
jgi:hypothetical protein